MVTVLLELGLILGLVMVASSPSPYYAALGLVSGTGMGCLILLSCGASFLCLVVFLVYLGGMMVVFAYSSSLVVDLYPEAWGSREVMGRLVIYGLVLAMWYLWNMSGLGLMGKVGFLEGEAVYVNLWFGMGLMFTFGGVGLLVVGWALLLTLLVILEVVSGFSSGVLRAL